MRDEGRRRSNPSTALRTGFAAMTPEPRWIQGRQDPSSLRYAAAGGGYRSLCSVEKLMRHA